nr:PREDICTED: TLR4 interactor with leucine rich repeats-like [Lepisosteus oculatus]
MAKFVIYLISLFPYKIQASLCPEACNCNDMDVFCSNSGLTYVPQILGTHSPAQYLSLGGNFIRSVGTGDFLFYTQLNRLDLQYNVISSIQPRSFESLKKLKELYLGHNRISFLVNQSFSGLSNLLYLDLNKNQLSSVQRDAFNGLVNLRKLRLSGNDVSYLPSGLFSDLKMLELLYLEDNRISSLSRNVFKGLGNLRELYLSRNNVTILSGDVFKHLRSLSDIQLDDNAITRIWNGNFLTLSELKTLSLSNNVITEIDSGAFNGLSKLKVLNVDGNRISAIGKQFLSRSLHLEEIDLSGNQIGTVEESALDGLRFLTVLKLNNNNLRYLNPGVFKTNLQLSILDLHDNPWHCNCGIIDLKNWLKSSSDRILTTFVKCSIPEKLKGMYLDFVSSEVIQSADPACPDTMLSDEPGTFMTGNRLATQRDTEEEKETHTRATATRVFTMPDSFTTVIKNTTKRHITSAESGKPQSLTTQATSSYGNRSMSQNTATPTLVTTTAFNKPSHLKNITPCDYNQNAILNISARVVTSNSAEISWNLARAGKEHVYFRIMYDQFDGNIRFSRFINVNKGNVCNLRDLRASTSYFVCVETVVNEKVCEVAPRDLCIGIVTKGEENSTPDPQLVILYISGANAVAITITLVIIICAVVKKTRKSPPDSSVPQFV